MALKPAGRAIVIAVVAIAIGAGIHFSGALNKIETASVEQPTYQPAQQASTAAPVKGGFDSYDRIMATREIKVGVQGNAKPFYDNGTGFNPDFLRLLAKQPEFSGVAIRVTDETNTYDEVPKTLLKKGGNEPLVDIALDGLTFQDGDVGGVVYTQPYVSGFGYALITNRTSGITSIAGVGSKRLGLLQGDPDVMAFAQRNFPNAQFVELSDALVDGKRIWIDQAFKMGQVDAVIYDYPFAVSEIAGTALQFAVAKLPDSDISYKIGVRTTDAVLMGKLNSAIQRVVETDEYRNLLRAYFNSKQIVATRASASERTHTVAAGDTLSLIAERLMGDRRKYSAIEARNNLPNPNLISVGQVLVIPN